MCLYRQLLREAKNPLRDEESRESQRFGRNMETGELLLRKIKKRLEYGFKIFTPEKYLRVI